MKAKGRDSERAVCSEIIVSRHGVKSHVSVVSDPTGARRTQGEIGEVRGCLRATPELSSSTLKGWDGIG